MSNASGHQGEHERQWQKSKQEHIRHFLRKTCNEEVSVVVQNNGKEIYKRCAARAKLFLLSAYQTYS